MSRHRLFLVLMAAGFLLVVAQLALHRRMAAAVQPFMVEPDGYIEIVNRALRGKLVLGRPAPVRDDDTGFLGEVGPVEGEASPVVEERLPEQVMTVEDKLEDADRGFLVSSFLLEDMQHPIRFERRKDDSLVLRPGFRRRPLPFADSGRWQGRILFRDGGRIRVVRTWDGRELRLTPDPDGRARAIQVPFRAPRPDEDPVLDGSVFSWSTGNETAFHIHALPGPDGSVTVALFRPRGAVGSLQQNGVHPDSREVLRPLEPGDWLVYRYGDQREVLWVDNGLSGVISDYRRGGQSQERSFQESYGLETWSRGVAGTMDRTISFIAEANARSTLAGSGGGPHQRTLDQTMRRDLQLSFDAGLQRAAQHVLDTEVHGRLPAVGWTTGGYPRLAPRAALTVMSIDTGELLAAATYPTAPQLDEHLERLRGAAGDGLSADLVAYVDAQATERYGRLITHQAFEPHQVGSTVKPLFGAAVALQWRPDSGLQDPLDLVVDCNGSLSGSRRGTAAPMPGTDIPIGAFQDGSHGRGVTFRSFLSESCHTFMFHLGAMALQMTDTFHVESCSHDLALVFSAEQATIPSLPGDVEGLGALGRFAWLTGARVRNPEVTGPDLWNQGWWRPFSDELREAIVDDLGCEQDLARSLAAISPPVVNLDLTSHRTCHPHYSSFLKGGGTNRWSNLDFSVAYARLITGQAIQGSLLQIDEEPVAAPTSDCAQFLGCDDPERYARVRGEVLAGMAGSLQPGGTGVRTGPTARALLEELEERTGVRWGAYSKTGSSRREVTMVKAVDEHLDPTKTEAWRLHVGNFTLLLVQCEDDPATPRAAGDNACAALPRPGQPVHGYVVHLWFDTVDGITGGAAAGRVLTRSAGTQLLDRLAEFEEDRP